jgi:hypothetical protein
MLIFSRIECILLRRVFRKMSVFLLQWIILMLQGFQNI